MNINTENVSKAEEELKLAYEDLIAFGKLFLPDDFKRSETPFFHYEVADAVDDASIRQLAVIMAGWQRAQRFLSLTLIMLSIILNTMIR
jgi:hypothetical protein